FVACIRLVVTRKSFAKCWRVMFAGRLLTDFRTVLSTLALTECFVIFLVASSQILTNSRRTAPSFSSRLNASLPSAAIRGVQKDRQKVHGSFRTRVDIARRADHSVAAVCRYRSACSRPGRLERNQGMEPTR